MQQKPPLPPGVGRLPSLRTPRREVASSRIGVQEASRRTHGHEHRRHRDHSDGGFFWTLVSRAAAALKKTPEALVLGASVASAIKQLLNRPGF